MSTHRSPTRRHHWSKRRHPDWYHLNKQVSYLPWMYWVDQCCHQVTKGVGELTCRRSDPSSDGQKKKPFTHGRSHVRVLSMRLSLPFHYPFTCESIWSYISLCEYFTLIYVCVNPRNRRIIKESIFFRIRHFIQRSFSRHECVNSRKERRNS